MRARIFFFQIVAIVGAGERDAQFFVDFDKSNVGDPLMVEPVGLHFKIEMVSAEDFLEFFSHCYRAIHIVHADQIGNLATQAA